MNGGLQVVATDEAMPSTENARDSRMAARTSRQWADRLGSSRVSGVLLIVFLLLAWELAVEFGVITSVSLPAFTTIAARFVELIVAGDLVLEALSTLRRMALGYGLAIIVGYTLGIVMGYWRGVYNLLEPLVELLRPIPGPAYIPIIILFLGIGDAMKVFVVVFASTWPILLNTYGGVRSVEKVQIDTARTFGLNQVAILKQVVVPAAAPFVFTGLRISLTVSFIVAIVSEMVASNDGLGYFILFAQRSYRIPDMFAGVAFLAMIGYCLNQIFLWVESRVLSWHSGAQAVAKT